MREKQGNSQGSCEHITISKGKGSEERLAGKPRAQDRRDKRNLWEKLVGETTRDVVIDQLWFAIISAIMFMATNR